MKLRISKRVFWWLSAVVVAAAACGCVLVWKVAFAGGVRNEGFVYLPRGSSFSQLLDSLRSGDRLSSPRAFMAAASAAGLQNKRFSGAYRLEKGMSNRHLTRMFGHGLQTPVRLTFNNVRTLPQLAGVISRQTGMDSVELLRWIAADSVAARYGMEPETMISMFIPNTYEVYWDMLPVRLTDKMQAEYGKFWNDGREARRKELGLSREEVSTLASIVYEETKMRDEMPRVAGVYVNRLRRGMPLQADPTVRFAIGDFGIRRVTRAMLKVRSPYNTYEVAGLPPGPICMPSIAALDAVLGYEKHPYLYFCAREDFSGYHNFAVTLAEHNANARRYARALDRQGIR